MLKQQEIYAGTLIVYVCVLEGGGREGGDMERNLILYSIEIRKLSPSRNWLENV